MDCIALDDFTKTGSRESSSQSDRLVKRVLHKVVDLYFLI